MDEAVAGHASRIEVDARARQPPDRHRQRPRHPGRPAPQISRQVGARGDHDHAPFGRQVRGQGLFDLAAASTASGSASSTPCRARRSSKSRATRSSTARAFSRGLATSPLEEVGAAPTAAARPSSSSPTPKFSAPTPRSTRAPLQAGPLQGLSLRRGRDPLALRSVAGLRLTSPKPPSSSSPAALPTISPSRSASRECVTAQPFTGRQDFPRRTRARPNGRSPGHCGSEGAESYYCNTIPTPDGGTHEAGLRAA